MKGAREFSDLLKTEQVGRLYIVAGRHARGQTLHIYVLPEGEVALPNGPCNACLNSSAVEVYGVIAGQPGWTEEYGWLHFGPWMEDFQLLVKERGEKKRLNIVAKSERMEEQKRTEHARKLALLSTYTTGAA